MLALLVELTDCLVIRKRPTVQREGKAFTGYFNGRRWLLLLKPPKRKNMALGPLS